MKNQTSLRIALNGLCAAATLIAGLNAGATIVGPYAPDANTLHLWHMDASAAPVPDAVVSGGMNLAGLLNGATLGNAAYSGFGNALNTASTGAGKNAVLAASATAGNVTITVADTTTGAFTFEANVWISFDPTTNGTGTYQIISAESGANANRIFQWRILPKTATVGPLLTFENIRLGATGQGQSIQAAIPTTGPDAIAINTWYHVAVSYNGQPSTANNIKFYWTLLDPSRTAANQISITSATTMLTGLNPLATITTPFMVGNLGRNINGNFVGMIDEVRISKIERNAVQMMFTSSVLSWITQPQSQFVAAGDTVTLTSLSGGESPQYHWQFYSTNLPNATNASLVLTNITLSQAGPYRVIATNSTSSITSDVATITVGGIFAEVFNTGLSQGRTLLSGGEVDPHWQLVRSDDPNFPGPAAVVIGSPISTYLASGPNSMWLAPVASGNAASGDYTYRTTFLLDTLDSANARLTGGWGMDNAGVDIILNGVSQGLTAAGFSALTPFAITNGFVPGVNTLDCIITNFPGGGANPTGVRVELRGVALLLSNVAPYLTDFPVNVTTQSQQTATFKVTAVGSGPLAYQWYKGVTTLTGQTSRTLVLSGLTPTDAGTYSVIITNSLGSTNATATLTVLTPPALAWLGIDPTSPTYWDTVTVNWLDTGSSANVAFAAYDDVIFDSRGSATANVDLIEPLNPNSIVVDAAADYTFGSITTGTGAITGTLTLTKKNTGKLVLDTTNAYSGGTIIQGGTLQVGNADTTGTLGSGVVSNNAALTFDRTDSFVVANSISGTGSVTMAGSGTLALSGKNTYSGPTIASAGTIYVRNSTALGDTSSGTTVANGAQLRLGADISLGAEPLTLSGVGYAAPLEGALHIDGGGVGNICGSPITLAADAGIKVDANGTLSLTNAAGIIGTDVSLAVQADSTGVHGTVSGSITLGAGSFTEYGAGTWVLLGTNNNWAGSTTINSPGVLQIGDGGANGSLGGATIANNGTLTLVSANNLLITNVISGGGPLNQNGTGMVTLTAANSYSGLTTIRGSGVLRITDVAALGSGQCTIGSAQTDTCRLELLGGITVANQIAIFPRVFYQTPPPTPVVAPDIVNVSGTNTLSPPASIVIPGGGNLLTLQADAGKLILTAGVTATGGGRHFVMRGAAAGEVMGNIDRTGANSQFVWKLDSGTWTLSGAMTPGAATTISNGVLVLNGTLDNVLTNAGGTLAGTGVISGPVYINAGATLSPGTSIGTMTVNNTLTLQPGSFTSMEINKTDGTRDQVVGMTSVTYGGTLQVNLSGTPQLGDAFKLFDAASYSGAFASITPATPGGGFLWLTNTLASDGTLRIQSTSVSQPGITSVVHDGTNVLFSGNNGAPWGGYSVVSSTNVALPMASWGPVAFGAFDGSGQFSITIPIDPAIPRRFFRVRAP